MSVNILLGLLLFSRCLWIDLNSYADIDVEPIKRIYSRILSKFMLKDM